MSGMASTLPAVSEAEEGGCPLGAALPSGAALAFATGLLGFRGLGLGDSSAIDEVEEACTEHRQTHLA